MDDRTERIRNDRETIIADRAAILKDQVLLEGRDEFEISLREIQAATWVDVPDGVTPQNLELTG